MRYEVVIVYWLGGYEKLANRFFGSYGAALEFAERIANNMDVVRCAIYEGNRVVDVLI